ncbi:MAG: hypothetical protein GPJ11_20130 [Microcystis aeruginosa L211-101]|jgi:uncharacterized protein (DUF697 family)|nr:hypothetical protein [Microcystis aeruginosa L211-11]NCR33098.1 hypothetical protein [Microcystis aeruginosa L211-101]
MATISQRNRANVLIHGAAVAASAASGALAFIALDTPILTGIYIGLVKELGKVFNHNVTDEDGMAMLAAYGGFGLGLIGVRVLLGWIPVLGNAANATISFTTTEAIGWYCFHSFDEKN